MVTPRAVLKRAITTEVSPGLTCIGDAVSTASGYSTVITESSGTAVVVGGTCKLILPMLMNESNADSRCSYKLFVNSWGHSHNASANSRGWCCGGFVCLWPDVS